MSDHPLYAGIDLGTSGCRLLVIDLSGQVLASQQVTYPSDREQTPELWWSAVCVCLSALAPEVHHAIVALAVDGTSGTLLLTDEQGRPTSPALMYHDNRAREQAARIRSVASADSAAQGTGSSLARLMWLLEHYPHSKHAYALHQADWIAGKLCGRFGFSDENNCLKLGYDPLQRQWPDWMAELVPLSLLPQVYAPGTAIPAAHNGQWQMHAGTTDSIAAFLATGANAVGDAVTSLGSTLVLKILCDQPVYAAEYGIYSHRLGDRWLAGGASNTGGAVLAHYFSSSELDFLSGQLQAGQASGLDYYPLLKAGERFPFNDPDLQPRLTPRPADNVLFLQGMLESMSRIEQLGWQRLQDLGAPWPKTLRTVGGGSTNPVWTGMRERLLGMKSLAVQQGAAAYGAALLASPR